MQLGDSVGVEVFSPDFTPLGPLERKTALRWLERFKSNGEFELWCPITEQNTALLVKDNIIWLGDESAGKIEYIDKERYKSSEFEFHVKGRMLECKLEGRVLYPTFNYSGQASGAMRDMVSKFCVSPDDDSRRITNLFLAEVGENFGGHISYQQTGSDVLEEQIFLSEANNVGFTVAFDPFNKQYLYKVLKPTDRSWSQVENDPVVFDSASDEILDSKYTINWANGRNVAVVAGQGEGSDRIVIEVQEGFYPITNLISNGNFETDISGWEVNGQGTLSQSADVSYIGLHSLKCVAPNAKAYSGPKINITSLLNMSHKYYLLCHGMCTVLGSSGYWYGEIGRTESGSNKYVNLYDGGNQTALNQWLRGCSYIDFLNSNVTSVWIAPIRFRNTGAAGDTMYQDGICLVDLTDAFGAGNEPDKTWCDTHLNYFDGTIYISKDGYVANNLIANGSFEDGTASPFSIICYNFEAAASSDKVSIIEDTSKSLYGTHCLSIKADNYYGTAYLACTITNIPKEHVYYYSFMYNPVKNVTFSDGSKATMIELETTIDKTRTRWVGAAGDITEGTGYRRISQRVTLTGDENGLYFTLGKWISSTSNTPYSCEIYADGWMLIDLTETFGAGNEPSKGWCDANIPFFEGTRVLSPSITKDLKRKELWVDARDLQKEGSDGSVMTDGEYKKLLHQRGLQRLSEYRYVESFKSTIKTFGYQQNVYGVDFLLGDIVTVIDRELGVTVNTQVTEVEQTWDSKGYQIDITFGNSQPTILDVIRREVRLNG